MKNIPKVILLAILAVFLLHNGVAMAADGVDNPGVPELESQFRNLAVYATPLGVRRGVAGDACACIHYQGIARTQDRDGVPFLFVSRSGNDAGKDGTVEGCSFFSCSSFNGDEKPGELVVARFGSRGRDGERLRSNRLKKDEPINKTMPPVEDKAIGYGHDNSIAYNFDGYFPKADSYKAAIVYDKEVEPKYMHPGGMHVVGDVLLIALDKHCEDAYWDPNNDCQNDGENMGAIGLIDVSDPAYPKLLSLHIPDPAERMYLVTATYVEERGQYLFMWTHDDTEYWFGFSDTSDLHTTTSITNDKISWNKDALLGDKDKWGSFQAINFVRDETTGGLYLIGTYNSNGSTPYVEWQRHRGRDRARLFKVNFVTAGDNFELQEVSITFIDEKDILLDNNPDYGANQAIGGKIRDPLMGNFAAAGGAYVSPSGQLILYSAPHDQQDNGPGSEDDVIKMGEIRSVNVRHDGLLPDAQCGGWVELYHDAFGWDNRLHTFKPYPSLMFDYIDRYKDNWDDLGAYDSFKNKTSALRYNLAPGQKAWLYDWEGKSIELIGDGTVQFYENLEHINFNGEDIEWNCSFLPPGPHFGIGLPVPDTCPVEDCGAEIKITKHAGDKIRGVEIEELLGSGDEVCDGIDNNCDGRRDEGHGDDTDQDGWGAHCDNCPFTYNPGQEDTDGDVEDEGDACDPVADANGPYVYECTGSADADVQLDGSGSFDPDGELVVYEWLVGGQTAFGVTPTVSVPLGSYDVNLEIQDEDGNTDIDQTGLSVQDTQAPKITGIKAKPSQLWPPNHKMRNVVITVKAEDKCDASPQCKIIRVSSDEPINGRSDGNTSPDWMFTGDLKLKLRAERSGKGNGRMYTVEVKCLDGSGNSTAGTTTISVPHFKGRKK